MENVTKEWHNNFLDKTIEWKILICRKRLNEHKISIQLQWIMVAFFRKFLWKFPLLDSWIVKIKSVLDCKKLLDSFLGNWWWDFLYVSVIDCEDLWNFWQTSSIWEYSGPLVPLLPSPHSNRIDYNFHGWKNPLSNPL